MKNSKEKVPTKQQIFTQINSIPIVMSILSAGLLITYGAYPHFYARISIIVCFITFIIPIMANYLICVINQTKINDNNEKVLKEVRSYLNAQRYIAQVENNNEDEPIKKQYKSKNNNVTHIKEYKHKIINNDNYSELKNLISTSCKSKRLKRQMILSFKDELNKQLASNVDHYSKMTFENDLHEVYVKLKSSHLEDKDYIYLKDYLIQLMETKKEA